MANHLAVTLDREKVAEMSCIAGVGGEVQPLVNTATSDRTIIALDGCPLECVNHCLEKHDVTPDLHYILAEEGVKKEYHTDYDSERADRILSDLIEDIQQELN